MQHFLEMLTHRMYGSSSSSSNRDAAKEDNISEALTKLAAAGIHISREELELMPATKKQVRHTKGKHFIMTAAGGQHTAML
jgi:hypothetical protein